MRHSFLKRVQVVQARATHSSTCATHVVGSSRVLRFGKLSNKVTLESRERRVLILANASATRWNCFHESAFACSQHCRHLHGKLLPLEASSPMYMMRTSDPILTRHLYWYCMTVLLSCNDRSGTSGIAAGIKITLCNQARF